MKYTFKRIPQDKGMFALLGDGNFIKGGTLADLKKFIEETQSKPTEYKGKFYCMPHCTECCHQLVKVTQPEIFKIRRALRKLSEEELQRLKNQDRDKNKCPLLDVEKGLCSVYDASPGICKAFGHFTGAMCCSYNLDTPLGPVEKHFSEFLQTSERFSGTLGVDYTWEKGLIR